MTDPAAPRPQRRMPHGAFGNDRFGVQAERFARFFGTPRFIIGQTIIVAIWITLNVVAVNLRWDPYPYILLNLAFSTQAAYAAPLILLAQTRQADRDKIRDDAIEAHRADEARREQQAEVEEAKQIAAEHMLAERLLTLLQENTDLTARVAKLTSEVHATIGAAPTG
jgi:uncharacterized membrane protein